MKVYNTKFSLRFYALKNDIDTDVKNTTNGRHVDTDCDI